MPISQTLSMMVLVKAAPVLTSELRETMCVAGMSLGSKPEWIRLHPVPFRDLEDDSKFHKYQEITLRAIRPRGDRRPESWTPIVGSIQLGDWLSPEHGWAARRQRVESLGESTMCELIEQNRSGSGPETTSLSVVRTRETPELLISRRDEEQLASWRNRAEALDQQPPLFEDPDEKRPPFEVVPWRFRYKYRCLASDCGGHKQTIVDWEAVNLWRNLRQRQNWQDLMRRKFVDELWASEKDTVLFVGNMEQRPWNFLVLGIFWPPRGGVQTSLLG